MCIYTPFLGPRAQEQLWGPSSPAGEDHLTLPEYLSHHSMEEQGKAWACFDKPIVLGGVKCAVFLFRTVLKEGLKGWGVLAFVSPSELSGISAMVLGDALEGSGGCLLLDISLPLPPLVVEGVEMLAL